MGEGARRAAGEARDGGTEGKRETVHSTARESEIGTGPWRGGERTCAKSARVRAAHARNEDPPLWSWMPLHSVPRLPFGCNQRDALPYIALSLVRVLTPLALPARIAARPVEACPLDVRGLVTRRPCAAGLLALRCLPRGERSRLASMYCRGLRLQSRGRLSAGLPKRCGAPCFFTRTVPWTRGIAGERSTSRTASRMRGSEDGSEEERGSRAGGLTACAGLDPAGAALAKAQFLSTRGSRSATMAQGADHAQSPWTACGPESGRASWGAVGRRPRGRGSRSRYGVEAARAKRSCLLYTSPSPRDS